MSVIQGTMGMSLGHRVNLNHTYKKTNFLWVIYQLGPKDIVQNLKRPVSFPNSISKKQHD